MNKPDFADYLDRRRSELGLDRQDVLIRVQGLLNEWYPDLVRAKRLHQGVLSLVTPSASVAGELRMRQMELLKATSLDGTRLAVSIGTIGEN